MTQPAAAPLSGAAVRQAPRLQSRRLPGRPGVARAASSADSQETGEPNGGLNTTFSALAAAGVAAMAAGVVQTGVVPAALPPQVLSTAAQVAQASVQNAVPLLGGTAVATSAAAVATTASAKRERGQQRVRLEQLKKEVAALQDLQQQELALLQLQMNAKAQEFMSAFQVLQDDLSREAEGRLEVESQLVAAQQKAASLEARVDAEVRERQRLQQAANRMESEAALNRREYLQLEDQAAALQAQLQAAHREVADAHALLEATNSRSEVLEQAWNEALQASKDAQLAAADSRSLELALARAQEDAAYLNTQLEQSQHEAAEASAALAAARGRTAMLEKAYAQANEEASQLRSDKRSLESALTQAQQEARALAAQLEEAQALGTQLEEAQRGTADAYALLDSLRSRTAMLEKSYAASMMEAQDAAQLRKQQRKLEAALSRAQEEASALSAELNAAQKDAAAAKALLSMSHGRNALVEKAWKTAQEDAMSLRGQQRRMQAALSAAQKEARALAAELERARAVGQLEAAYGSSAEHSELGTLRSRTSMLEKAYASATEEAKAEQARRVEAERQLEWSKREVQHLTWELEGAQASIATSAAGVETIVAQLPEVVGRWQDGTPRELAHLRNF